jgi:DNA-directed RNA polymerase I, II, and III subunit RPABC1
LQGYEVTEEEVQISLDDFKQKYSDPLGYPEYALSPSPLPRESF